MRFPDNTNQLDLLLDEYVLKLDQGGDEAELESVIDSSPPELRPELRLRCREAYSVRTFFERVPAKKIELIAGSRIDDFEVINEIGQGSMGAVYRARQLSLDREVALKLVHRRLVWRDDVLLRFKQEAMALASLEHPGIVRVHSAGDDDGRPFLAMQIVDGVPLDRAVVQRNLSDSKEDPRFEVILKIVIQILEALEYAHAAGIVHRDIKPENILIKPTGEVVLIDFGLAILRHRTRATAIGSAVGSPAYMSPERIEMTASKMPVASDVWSVGVVLFELLTGELPFDGDHQAAICQAITQGNAPHCRKIEPAIPVELAVIVQRALARSTDIRFASAGAFAMDLRAFLKGDRGQVDSLRWTRRLQSQFQSHRRLCLQVIPVALVALVLVLGIKKFTSENSTGPRQSGFTSGGADLGEMRYGVYLSVEIEGLLDEDVFVLAEEIDHVDGLRGKVTSLGRIPVVETLLKRGDYLLQISTESGRRHEIFCSFREPGRKESVVVAMKDLREVDTSNMIRIPAGPAYVGMRIENEKAYPFREVTIPEFWIDRCEVTCGEWLAYAQESGISCPWGEIEDFQIEWTDLPVVGLSCKEASDYASHYGKRLPTWSEWQKAARGPEGWEFPWGDGEAGLAAERAVVSRGVVQDEKFVSLPWDEGLAKVGTTLGDTSFYGVKDTLGNTTEWTSSWFVHDKGGSELEINRAARVICGLGWKDSIESIATDHPARRRLDLVLFGPIEIRGPGFRCVTSLVERN